MRKLAKLSTPEIRREMFLRDIMNLNVVRVDLWYRQVKAVANGLTALALRFKYEIRVLDEERRHTIAAYNSYRASHNLP